MVGSHDLSLVTLSFVGAVCVSYMGLHVASRLSVTDRKHVGLWLAGGATAMGIGIWSMHFICMLAFSLPIDISHDIFRTLGSLGVAIAVSGFALIIATRTSVSLPPMACSPAIIGLGISAMHYSGISAIEIAPSIHYEIPLVILSIAIAIASSFLALKFFFRLRRSTIRRVVLARAMVALAMGIGVCGMHYTGMLASRFAPDSYWLSGAPTATSS